MKTLSIIIPCYGKSNEVVNECIKSAINLKNNNVDEIEILFAYKNSNKYNYDWVKKIINIDKVIEYPENYSKVKKVDETTALATGKYVSILDSDDTIVDINIKEIIEELKNTNCSLFILNYLLSKNGKITKVSHSRTWANYNCLYRTDILKSNINKNAIDSNVMDDFIRNLLQLSVNKEIMFSKNYLINYHIYSDGSNISINAKWNDFIRLSLKQVNEIEKYLNFNKSTNKMLSIFLGTLIMIHYKKTTVKPKEFKKAIKLLPWFRRIPLNIALYYFAIYRKIIK